MIPRTIYIWGRQATFNHFAAVMKFAYVASLLLAVVPLSFASPGVTRRDADNSDIIGVLQTFKASTQIILPQISALRALAASHGVC